VFLNSGNYIMKYRLFLFFFVSFAFVAITKPSLTADTPSHTVPLLSSNGPAIEILIHGEPYTFIVDTGSFQTIILPELANKTARPDEKNLRIAGGRQGDWHLIAAGELELQVSGTNFSRSLVVATLAAEAPTTAAWEQNLTGHHGILGLDFFYGTQLVFDGPKQTFEIIEPPEDQRVESGAGQDNGPYLGLKAICFL